MSIPASHDHSLGLRAIGLGSLLLLAALSPAQSPLRFGAAQPIDDATGFFYSLPLSVDLDRDGDQDLLYAVGNYYAIRWLENTGGSPAVYARHEITSYGSVLPYGRTPIAADFDNDGDLDVMANSSRFDDLTSAELSWWEQPEDPVNDTWKKRTVSTKVDQGTFFAEYLNADGRLDLITLGGKLTYFLNSAEGPVAFSAPTSLYPTSNDPKFVRTDLDLDGRIDLVGSYDYSSPLSRLELTPGMPPGIDRQTVVQASGLYRHFDVEDLNGDGLPDVAFTIKNGPADYVYVAYNNPPGGAFSNYQSVSHFKPNSSSVKDLEIADLDFDGRNDIFAIHYEGELELLPNGGGQDSFSRFPILAASPLTQDDMALIDVDRDGDLDLVRSEDKLEFYPNESSAYIRSARLLESVHDGSFGPGEAVMLQVELGNLSPKAVHDVTVDLSGSSAGLLVGNEISSVETIARGGRPYLSIPLRISNDVLCEAELEVDLLVKEGGTEVDHYVVPISIGKGEDGQRYVRLEESPQSPIPNPIVDGSDVKPVPVPLERTLEFSIPTGVIRLCDLDFTITHSFVGDLKVTITSPTGTTRTVYTGATDDSQDQVNVYTDLPWFRGEQASGKYVLTVIDRMPGDTGTLDNWSLAISADTHECDLPAELPAAAESLLAIAEPQPSDDVNGDGVIDCADLVPAE
jgi:subtilisin-like proprotein convertase family protein